MNLYVSLGDLKKALKVQGDSRDDELLLLDEQVARSIDAFCARKFYPYTATHYFDPPRRGVDLSLGRFDLLTVTTMKVDLDGDGVYETTLAAGSDYLLRPLNVTPKESVRISERSSQLSSWPTRAESIEIAARWGYSADVVAVGTITEPIGDTTSTTITLSADHTAAAGHTLVIDSEDMYCSRVEGLIATVQRGINGTTAATHADNASVSRRRADPLIERAALIQCARLWRDTGTGGGNVASEQFGGFTPNSLYPVVRDLLRARRRPAAGVR